MRILISGGTGFIGGRLAAHLSRLGHQVIIGSRKPKLSLDWLEDAKLVQMDWNDQNELSLICHDIDIVIHSAGMNAEDCLASPIEAINFNGVTTARFVSAAVKAGVKKFIYLSSAHVYSSPLTGTITEKTCPTNLHPYATSHLTGEQAVLFAGYSNLIQSVVLRMSNLVGAPMHKEVNCWSLLTNNLCRQAVETKQLVLNSNGLFQRDFLGISEAVKIISYLINYKDETIKSEIFNLGAGRSLTLLHLAQLVQTRCEVVLGFKPDILAKSVDINNSLNFSIEKLEKYIVKVNSNLVSDIDELLNFCFQKFGMQ